MIRWSESLEQNLAILRSKNTPWIVFCCPPYALWESQGEALTQMLNNWIEKSPSGSLFAVELETKRHWICFLNHWNGMCGFINQHEWQLRKRFSNKMNPSFFGSLAFALAITIPLVQCLGHSPAIQAQMLAGS